MVPWHFQRALDKEKGSPRSPRFARLAPRPAYFKGSLTRKKGRLARRASLGSLGTLPTSKAAWQGERVASLAPLRSARSASCLSGTKLDKEEGSPRSPHFARLLRRPAYFKGKLDLSRLASLGSLGTLPIPKGAGQGEKVASLVSIRSAPCLFQRKLDKEKGSSRSPRFARRPAYFKGRLTRRKGRFVRLARLASLGALPL